MSFLSDGYVTAPCGRPLSVLIYTPKSGGDLRSGTRHAANGTKAVAIEYPLGSLSRKEFDTEARTISEMYHSRPSSK
jgi:hypothetical protein